MSRFVFRQYDHLKVLVLIGLDMLCQQATAAYAVTPRTSKFEDVDAPILYVAVNGSARNLQ